MIKDDCIIFSKDGGHLNYIEINGKEINIDKLPFYKKYLIKGVGLFTGGFLILAGFVGMFISVPFIALLWILTFNEKCETKVK